MWRTTPTRAAWARSISGRVRHPKGNRLYSLGHCERDSDHLASHVVKGRQAVPSKRTRKLLASRVMLQKARKQGQSIRTSATGLVVTSQQYQKAIIGISSTKISRNIQSTITRDRLSIKTNRCFSYLSNLRRVVYLGTLSLLPLSSYLTTL